ncbi:MAG TPA: YhdP family protein [Gammaproteobacteria bacterium]|nr:YhdP family protein [Gammaproteobacteria bacterium]
MENVSLPQWFNQKAWHQLHFDQGIGTATISAKWEENRWQKIESTLKFYEVKVNLPEVFGNLLRFEQITGQLDFQQNVNGAWLMNAKNVQAINPDLNALADFSMNFPQNNSPDIQLTSQFTLRNAKNVSHYLPLKIFDPDLIIWLKNAFLAGQVVNGNALVKGKLSDFPFADGTGKFEISGVIKGVDLKYAPEWPYMQNINGKILFSGKSMAIDIASAQILDVPLTTIHAEIPNLGENPVLAVKDTIHANLSQGLNLIQKSPLKKTIGKNLSELKLQGDMQLALSLDIPLNHPGDVKVMGDTTIANSILMLPGWNLQMDQLNGTFHFTEDSIVASSMTGRLFGHAVTLDLETLHPKNKSGYVTADLQGAINTADLKQWLNLPIEEVIQGTTNYKTKLILPPQDSSVEPARVMIQSDLKGIAVNLPGNYSKNAEDAADFNLNFDVKEKQPLKAKIAYNKLFSLAMTLARVKQNFKLLSANLNLGNGEANWQTQPGIIITGNIDRIDWDKIAPHVSQFLSQNNRSSGLHDFSINPDLFRALDIHTNTLNFSGFKLENLRIQLSKTSGGFILSLTNPDIDGQIILPRAGIQQGIQARFQRLNFSSKIPSNIQNKIKPSDLPPISFVGEDVRLGTMSLGCAVLNLQPAAGGLSIRQLELGSVSYKLQATGMWMNEKSRLQGNVVTSNVSDFLKSIGFPSSNLIGSKGNADFDLNWSGGLFPSVAALSGTISLKLSAGQIINLSDSTDAKMGLGRLLNIFSLQSLPRRLSLNFSDLSQKGYSFDSLAGDFILKNGNAFTQNTQFKGPIAGIQISGRIGLAAKDLDLKLSVTPYVTGSLPVVAAIAAANPVAGIATWVVDKMVSPAVSQMATYNYAITGSWENPDWNQISTQKITQPGPVQQPLRGR